MRKKDILAYGLNILLPKNIFGHVKHLVSKDLIVLAYHRVKNINESKSFYYDSGLISASQDQFEYQISYIKKYFNPISEIQLINYLYNNISLPPQAVMVTFDDGFDDNYYYAYPILKKYAVPATMFISTSYIGQDEPIWFDWLASLFLAGSMNSIDIPLLKKVYINGNYLDNYANFHDLIKIIREIGNENRLEILSQLRDDYSAYMSHIDTSESRFMNWEQIIELSKNDISIGSHTVTHPIMSRLNHPEVRYELIQSKKDIETHTLINVNSFSYPTGQTSSFTDGIVEEVINAGYKVAYTYIHAVNKLPIKNYYKIKRLHIENEAHNSYFNSMMMFPAVFKD